MPGGNLKGFWLQTSDEKVSKTRVLETTCVPYNLQSGFELYDFFVPWAALMSSCFSASEARIRDCFFPSATLISADLIPSDS